MRVRKTFLILYLATGLSVGLLSGCNPFSNPKTSPSPSPSPTTGSPLEKDNQPTSDITNLETLQQKRAALNTFVANIKVTENGTKVENPVDYAEAKKIVDELANAYKTFKDSLSDDIKTKIGFNNIYPKIEPILEGTSQQRKILEDLAKSQYREAQTKLSQLEINSRPIYQSDIDGEDGSKQRIATKKLLEQILNVTQPLATLKIDNSSTQNPTNSNSPTNSLTTDDLKTQLEQLKKDINSNNWIWSLFNTLALLSVPISFIFLWIRMSDLLINYQTKQTKNSSDEQPKILEHLQTINSKIKGWQEKFPCLKILSFNRKQVSSSEVQENQAEKGLITEAKSTSLDENTPDIPGASGVQVSTIEKKDIDQLKIQNQELQKNFDELREKYQQLQKNFDELREEMGTKSHNKLESRIEQLENLLNQVQPGKDTSELLDKKIEREDILQQWQNIIDSYNESPDAIFKVNGVKKQGEVVEDEEKGGERWNNSSTPFVLTSNINTSGDGFYVIISVGNDYLLFPKQHAIAESQDLTASALFDGYISRNISKFTLISPAQVTPIGGGGMWQLKYKGRLEYK